jgi:hypothetical protein
MFFPDAYKVVRDVLTPSYAQPAPAINYQGNSTPYTSHVQEYYTQQAKEPFKIPKNTMLILIVGVLAAFYFLKGK